MNTPIKVDDFVVDSAANYHMKALKLHLPVAEPRDLKDSQLAQHVNTTAVLLNSSPAISFSMAQMVICNAILIGYKQALHDNGIETISADIKRLTPEEFDALPEKPSIEL